MLGVRNGLSASIQYSCENIVKSEGPAQTLLRRAQLHSGSEARMASIFHQIDRPIDSFHFPTRQSARGVRAGRFRHHFHFSPSLLRSLSLSNNRTTPSLLSGYGPFMMQAESSCCRAAPSHQIPLSGRRALILSLSLSLSRLH